VLYSSVDEPRYFDVEDRWASLLVVGRLCIEPMAPNHPVNAAKPVGKFYSKYGRHWHSVGFKVDDLVGLGNDLIAKGVHIGKPGGGKLEQMDPDTIYFYPSPRDTAGLMVELCWMDMPGDPRDQDSWSSLSKMWNQIHPLGLRPTSFITLGVINLEDAVERYVELFDADVLHEGTDDAEGARFAMLRLGDSLLRLAQPIDGETLLGRHVAEWGNMIYSVTMCVEDLDAAEAWLTKKGIRTSRPGAQLLAADPDDTFGAPFFFTTADIPNDPFVRGDAS
jgi:hypothetical protein